MAVLSLTIFRDGSFPISGAQLDANLVWMARSTASPPVDDLEGPRPSGPTVMLRPAGPVAEIIEKSCGIQSGTTTAEGRIRFVWDPQVVEQHINDLVASAGPRGAKLSGEFRVTLHVDGVKREVVFKRRIQRSDEGIDQKISLVFAYSCVGHTTTSESTIWFALVDPGQEQESYSVRVSKFVGTPVGGGFSVWLPNPVSTVRATMNGRTGTARIAGLDAGSSYRYEVVKAGPHSPTDDRIIASGSFGTMKRNPGQIRVAFGSCKDLVNTPSKSEVLRSLANQPRDMLFLIGDQLYGDSTKRALDGGSGFLGAVGGIRPGGSVRVSQYYENAYLYSWRDPSWRECLTRGPVYMMLDDHDISDDWGTTFTEATDAALVGGGLDAYRKWQHSHNPPTPPNDYHFHFSVGAATFFFLDLRTHRRIREDPDHPLLGSRQATALAAWAANDAANADVAVLVSPVPLALMPADLIQGVLDRIQSGRQALEGLPFVGDGVELAFDIIESGFEYVSGKELYNGRVVEPDVADQWVVEPAMTDLKFVLDTLFDLANDVAGGGRRRRAVIVLAGDSHVGAIHEITSNDPRHSAQPSIVQLTSSPLTANPAGEFAGKLGELGLQVDALLNNGLGMPSPYFARFLSMPRFLVANNFGMLSITRTDPTLRAYRIEGSIRSGSGSLIFDRQYNLSARLSNQPGTRLRRRGWLRG
ncbi:alkaline phosphatase D family protein [Streptomyces sp. NPDC002889]|uniref:alkaline phosphatase D family protein n=1 Tax=Streptomyces sp. NPDC002889 TaxID=3364669 RepID=UPI0036A71375